MKSNMEIKIGPVFFIASGKKWGQKRGDTDYKHDGNTVFTRTILALFVANSRFKVGVGGARIAWGKLSTKT